MLRQHIVCYKSKYEQIALKLKHLKEKLQLTEPIASWLVRHSCWQIFRFLVHSENQTTGFERVLGRIYNGAVVPFGEVVLARVHDDPSLGFHLQVGQSLVIWTLARKVRDHRRTPCDERRQSEEAQISTTNAR